MGGAAFGASYHAVRENGDEEGQEEAAKGQGLLTMGFEARFWSKVDIRGVDECWEWQAAIASSGYGAITVGSRRDGTRRTGLSHRIAWELTYGPIPDGLCVLHRCDNRACCNPCCLFLGTKTENSADMVAKGRQALGDRNSSRLRPERLPRGDQHWSRRMPERMSRGEKHSARMKEVIANRMEAR